MYVTRRYVNNCNRLRELVVFSYLYGTGVRPTRVNNVHGKRASCTRVRLEDWQQCGKRFRSSGWTVPVKGAESQQQVYRFVASTRQRWTVVRVDVEGGKKNKIKYRSLQTWRTRLMAGGTFYTYFCAGRRDGGRYMTSWPLLYPPPDPVSPVSIPRLLPVTVERPGSGWRAGAFT